MNNLARLLRGFGSLKRVALVGCQLLLAVVGLGLSSPSQAAPQRLRVVSYNVWGIRHISPKREERIAAIAKQLGALNADVVALQEVWEPEDAAVLAEELRAAGMSHQRVFGVNGEGEQKSGLWLASRHPIVGEKFTAYEAGQEILFPWHVDWMAKKGFAVVQIQTPSGVVAVANTHLQSGYRFYDYEFIRLGQALELSDALVHIAPDMPLIMVGDFNDVFDSLPLRALGEGAQLRAASDTFDIDAVLSRAGGEVDPRPTDVQLLWMDPMPLASGEKIVLSDHPCVLVDYDLTQATKNPETRLAAAADIAANTTAAAAPIIRRPFVQDLAEALSSERRYMRWGSWLLRAATLLLLVAAWVCIRRSWFTRRWLNWACALSMMLVAAWSANAAWVWAPAKIAMMAKYERALGKTPGQSPGQRGAGH